jgi:multiple sugar transport system ATP-binding protein
MMAGLEEVTSGEVQIDGVRCDHLLPSARGMAMVFQSYALYPHMSVEQNLRFGLENQRLPKAEIATRVRRAAEILQIGHLLQRRPTQLSGGQSQRVAIGRAIVKEPKAFLFDEPLSNLDAELRVKMRGELTALHQRL